MVCYENGDFTGNEAVWYSDEPDGWFNGEAIYEKGIVRINSFRVRGSECRARVCPGGTWANC